MLLLLFLLPWILHSNWICFSVQSHNYLCILYIIVFKYFSVDFNLHIGTTLFCKSSFVFDEQQKLWFLLTMNTEFLCIVVNDLVLNYEKNYKNIIRPILVISVQWLLKGWWWWRVIDKIFYFLSGSIWRDKDQKCTLWHDYLRTFRTT